MIKGKRTSLIQFIRQQVHGPGALNHKYQNITPAEDNTICEYLNGAPAKYYATGILFPNRAQECVMDLHESTDAIQDLLEVMNPESESSEMIDDQLEVGDQTYPSYMGITVALDGDAKWEDLLITFKFRTYRKLKLEEARTTIGVALEMEPEHFSELANLFLIDDVLRTLRKNDKDILAVEMTSGITDVKARLYAVVKDADKKFRDHLISRMKITNKDLHDININQIRSRSIRDLKSNPNEALRDYLSYLDRYSKFKGHIQNVLELIDGDIWEGRTHIKQAIIPSGPLSLREGVFAEFINKEEPILIHDDSDKKLKVHYLLTRDRRDAGNTKKYLKIQLYNYSTSVSLTPPKFYSVENTTVNERSFFGVEIEMKSGAVTEYQEPSIGFENLNSEEKVNRVIYRKMASYGTGHGTSVKWEKEGPMMKVSSCYLPLHESVDIDTTPRNKFNITTDAQGQRVAAPIFPNDSFLQIKKLSTLSTSTDQQVMEYLQSLSNGYAAWISENAGRNDVEPEFVDTARDIMGDCRSDCERIERNIALLARNDFKLMKIFRYMNTVMYMQMIHRNGLMMFDKKNVSLEDYRLLEIYTPKWRPFQLAFILLNIDGILSPSSSSRDVVDLVWFPTGGGKTEAYLSLIAMTILYRRSLLKEKGLGTAVIMRYTLRLLALQQFQRATVLIMALELIRRWKPSDMILGDEPILIGLWTGVSIAPNAFEDLKEQINTVKAMVRKETGRKVEDISLKGLVHQKCPWCNSSFINTAGIEYCIDYSVERGRSYLFCSNENCPFSRLDNSERAIPILTCDEEIYRFPPALLFGTVDKFAALAHKVHKDIQKDSRRLFGNAASDWAGKKNPLPPDLIIQDELHLISGPLGSATALVEFAIQELCIREMNGEKFGAKIISSTATIRNSTQQVLSLYGMSLNLFPKPGIDADDSFFSFYKRQYLTNDPSSFKFESKRAYLGAIPNGHSHMWMQLRLTAICLVHRAVFETDLKEQFGNEYPADAWKALDYYHTVLSYFNSLKELGKTDSQVNTYLEKEVRRVYKNILYPDHELEILYTEHIHKQELTGRLSGDEVKISLSKVETPLDHELQARLKKVNLPPDFVLATNMISVGLDIGRLNTMIVNSMPRSISEYIQATSRVARESHGLVITVHHPYRTRDVSHFERFVEFHQRFYGHVEPISITPLTTKTLDKFLSLFIGIITRHKFRSFALRSDANTILDITERTSLIQELNRLANSRLIQENEKTAMRQWINEAITQWQQWAQQNEARTLVYDHASNERNEVKLFQNSKSDRANPLQKNWDVPHSLRSVEEGTVINVKPL
jgi:superfamily II DNA/RNA helicase